VTEAIVSRFADSAALVTAFTTSGGLWFGEIPSEEQLDGGPFIALFYDGDAAPINNSGTTYVQATRYHFEMYHTALETLRGYVKTLEALYDKPKTSDARATFSITGVSPMGCVITGSAIEPFEQRTAESELVHKATVPIEFTAVYSR
jgi:hypothetical protein